MVLINIVKTAIELYTWVLVIYALLSWFPGAYESRIGQLIIKISRPYLSLFERARLNLGPIDFTIIVAVFVLQLAGRGLILLLTQIMMMIQ